MNIFSKNAYGVSLFFGILVALILLSSFAPARAATACAVLPVNLFYGDNGADVLALQNFLFSRGYLMATPNGHFGPATLAAVQKFQSENAIATVGSAGPLTRAAIQRVSCQTPSLPTPLPTITPTPTASPTPAPSSSAVITSPKAGDALVLGSNVTIAWIDSSHASNYTILLEQPNGVGAGYISIGSYASHQYVWKTGSIISTPQPVDPGTYRIHIMSTGNSYAFDQYSNVFTITAPPVTIVSSMPVSLPANDATVGVLYGSGFTNMTVVYIDGVYAAHVLYTSPDGRALVYTIPVTVPVGLHTMQARNVYASGQTALSGVVNLTITAAP